MTHERAVGDRTSVYFVIPALQTDYYHGTGIVVSMIACAEALLEGWLLAMDDLVHLNPRHCLGRADYRSNYWFVPCRNSTHHCVDQD